MSFILSGLESVGSGISNFFGGFGSSISSGISDFTSGIGNLINEIINGIKGFIGSIQSFFSGVVKTFDSVGKSVDNVFSEVWNFLRTTFGDLVSFFKNLPEMIETAYTDLVNFFKTVYNDIRAFVGGALGEFTNILSGIITFIVQVMTYPFNYIRYVFNTALYYLVTHASNLVGGFFFGMFINEVRKMKYTSLGEAMAKLAFEGGKYFLMDTSIQGLFMLYNQRNKIKKPVPPSLPMFTGVKL